MGLLGRYVDELPDVARDRVIRAKDWCAEGARALVGHAEGRGYRGRWAGEWTERARLRAARLWRLGLRSHSRISRRFGRACQRFGPERMVRLLKLRAAKQHGLSAGVARRGSS